jgi:uncharacterized protein YjbJ (UPF0337 family)
MDAAQGQDPQAKGQALTDDEIDQLQGNAEVLIGKIQERYERSSEQQGRAA